MQISSRFTLAVHIFACMDTFGGEYKVTSDFLAGSTNVNPVMIRKILGQLKGAGLIEVARGTGGATVTRPLGEITFLDIYRAVECVENGELFHFHETRARNVPSDEIFIIFWTISCCGCRRLWRRSLLPLRWKISGTTRRNIFVRKESKEPAEDRKTGKAGHTVQSRCPAFSPEVPFAIRK